MAILTVTPGGAHAAFNSATPVTAVPAPAASHKRICGRLYVNNKDTATVTVIVKIGADEIIREAIIAGGQANLTTKDNNTVQEAAEAMTVELTGAPATNQPIWSTSWLDWSLI